MPEAAHVTFTTHGDPPLRLEGLLHRAKAGTASVGRCVILHPHAAFRGSMDTWLLSRIASRLAEDGWNTLRFNFRGVGASEGSSGDGTGELHDALGALAFLNEISPGEQEAVSSRVAVVGWGFGALVGLLLAEHPVRITDWVGIGPPTRCLKAIPMVEPPSHALAGWPARRCVIVGELDQLYPPRSVAVLAPDSVHVVAAADHFMTDRYEEIADIVARVLRRDAPI